MPKPMRVGDFRMRMREHLDEIPADIVDVIEQLLDINNRLVEAYLHEQLPDTEETPTKTQVLVNAEIYESEFSGAIYARPLVMRFNTVPTSSSDTTGVIGEVRFSNTHIYLKCPDGSWRRGAIAAF